MRVGVIGSGLMGTSIALAAARVGCQVTTWDLDIDRAVLAAGRGGFASAPTMGEAVDDADIVVGGDVPLLSADETLPWARAIAALPDQVYVPLLDLGALSARLTEVST